jgi:hypothetical protein
VSDARKKAEALLNKVNEGYGDETFVSEGYGYFDDMAEAIEAALTAERVAGQAEGIEMAANTVVNAEHGGSGRRLRWHLHLVREIRARAEQLKGQS